LFIRSDEIEAAWKFIDSITFNWNSKTNPLHIYSVGSDGPEPANELIEQDGRQWWTK
jgi:glucose-6-phosphate 1-dehydrogenase